MATQAQPAIVVAGGRAIDTESLHNTRSRGAQRHHSATSAELSSTVRQSRPHKASPGWAFADFSGRPRQ